MSAELTGAAYVAAMDRDPMDREYRRAFQQLAQSLAPARGSVFDFGSGPGIDARHYAAAGMRVGAYDVDASMCAYFRDYCAEELRSGAVRLHTGDYAEFLGMRAAATAGAFDLVTANFAPLNLVPELPPLFAKFAALLKPDGRVLASVLNPAYRDLLRLRGWWLRAPLLALRGRFTVRLGGITPVTRWLPRRLARRAAPHFALTAIHVPVMAAGGARAVRVRAGVPRDWPRLLDSQFLFLQFERKIAA